MAALAYYKTGDDLQPTQTFISSNSSYGYSSGINIVYDDYELIEYSHKQPIKYIHPVNLLYASFNYIRFERLSRNRIKPNYYIRQPVSNRKNKIKMNFQRLLKKYFKRIKEAV